VGQTNPDLIPAHINSTFGYTLHGNHLGPNPPDPVYSAVDQNIISRLVEEIPSQTLSGCGKGVTGWINSNPIWLQTSWGSEPTEPNKA
jgi:hypothetical protein